jgi:hypothetical protein
MTTLEGLPFNSSMISFHIWLFKILIHTLQNNVHMFLLYWVHTWANGTRHTSYGHVSESMLKMQIWYEFQKLGERCVQTWEPFLFFFMGNFLPNIDDLKKKKNQMFCCKFSFFKWKKTFCLQKLFCLRRESPH